MIEFMRCYLCQPGAWLLRSCVYVHTMSIFVVSATTQISQNAIQNMPPQMLLKCEKRRAPEGHVSFWRQEHAARIKITKWCVDGFLLFFFSFLQRMGWWLRFWASLANIQLKTTKNCFGNCLHELLRRTKAHLLWWLLVLLVSAFNKTLLKTFPNSESVILERRPRPHSSI